MQTILSQAAIAKTTKAEGATTIPKGSRFQVEPKRGASSIEDEKIVWTCWRQQENKRKRFICNNLGICFLQYNVYRYAPAGHYHAAALYRRGKQRFIAVMRKSAMGLNQTNLLRVNGCLRQSDCVAESALPTPETHRAAVCFSSHCTPRSKAQRCREHSLYWNRRDLGQSIESPTRERRRADICRQLCISNDECLTVLCRNKRNSGQQQFLVQEL